MADFTAARMNMVESQVRTQDVTDVRIHDAMRAIPRERFVPEGEAWRAYTDAEAEYAPGRFLLKPRDVAKLINAARPMPGERVLAIAAPYAAAVIEAMGLDVVQVAPDAPIPAGPFDVVICEGAVARAPDAWTAVLAEGGRLAAVEREGSAGRAVLYLNAGGRAGRREIFDCFAPVMPGFEARRRFAL